MSRIIDRGLEEQSVLLVRMGELTYEVLEFSIRGYLNGKSNQKQVKEFSDELVAMADKIEDQTFQLIARFQPVASDLRTIKSYMKIGNDFARYGRYALDISIINDQFSGLKACPKGVRAFISQMSQKVLNMVKISVDALKKYDTDLAKSIVDYEPEVDAMYLNHLKTLISEAQTDNKCVISSVLMARYLERIADHATYVCEAIVYIATGEKIILR